MPVPVVGRAPELDAAVVDAAADVGLTDDGVVVGPVGVVVGPVGVVVAVVVGGAVVVGADWQSLAFVTNGAAIRPRASPLPVNTAFVSIWPQLSVVDSDPEVAPAGITPDASWTFGLDEIPRWERTRIGVPDVL